MTRPSRSTARSPLATLGHFLHSLLSLPLGTALIVLWWHLSQPGAWGVMLIIPTALILWRPALWLPLWLALLAVIDRTAYTGNGYFTESDALLGALLIALGLRGMATPVMRSHGDGMHLRWSAGPAIAIGLLWLSYIVALLRGLLPLPGVDVGSFVLFDGSFEALRIARGPLLALWCLPFLGRWHASTLRTLPWAAVLCLLGVAGAVLIERISFTSLTDFATDYRTTGSFWEMHVGGAALDGALVLTWPFAVWAAVRSHGPLRIVAGLAALLGAYAVLAGFTRSTYAAAVVSLGVLLVVSLWRPDQRQARSQAIRWPVAALITLTLIGAAYSFGTSGYRGLAALLTLAVCVWLGAGHLENDAPPQRPWVLAGLAAGAALGMLGLGAAQVWDKAVYASVPAALLLALASTLAGPSRRGPLGHIGAFAALVWAAIAAVAVAAHWGGSRAIQPMALAAAALLALALVPALAQRAPWRVRRHHLVPLCVVLGCTGMTIAVGSSYYAGARFAAIGNDMDTRVDNWRRVLTLVDRPATALIGLGAGQFPLAYRWKVLDSLYSGDMHVRRDDQGSFASIGAPRHPQGGEEVFRMTQRLSGHDIALPARLRFSARAPGPAQIGVELCRKHLIYPDACISAYVSVPGDGQWHAREWRVPVGDLNAGPWYAVRPLTFAISAQGTQAFDATGFSLVDANGAERLDNGDFTQGGWRWFSASDRQHLPWHAKNVFLHMLVENGALGVVALGLAFVVAGVRLLTWPANLHPYAAPLLASLAGFLVAGMFDSIIDAPRVAMMLFLWLGVALGLRPAEPKRD
ncbi:MAG: hypothetical protein QM639_11810 [Rhodocyclaceae bacterium]